MLAYFAQLLLLTPALPLMGRPWGRRCCCLLRLWLPVLHLTLAELLFVAFVLLMLLSPLVLLMVLLALAARVANDDGAVGAGLLNAAIVPMGRMGSLLPMSSRLLLMRC